jgi:hypothetical protein
MMKAFVSLSVLGLAVAWSGSSFAQFDQDKMMAEMKKCAVCKNLAENPELMKNMSWETHKIDNGMLSVTSAPKKMNKDLAAVSEKMHQAIEQVKADTKEGKEVHLCGFCGAMAELMKQGAKQQDIKTKAGEIHMCTSDDPAVVKKIHEIADQAIAIQKQIAESRRTASLQ